MFQPERPFTRKKVVNMGSSQEKIFILVFTTFLVNKKVVNTDLFYIEEKNVFNFALKSRWMIYATWQACRRVELILVGYDSVYALKSSIFRPRASFYFILSALNIFGTPKMLYLIK